MRSNWGCHAIFNYFSCFFSFLLMTFCASSDSKESACNAGDLGSIPGSGRSSGEGNGKPFQYSCLENPLDRGAWRATVHEVTKSWTLLKWLSTQHNDYFWFFKKFCQMSFIMFCLVDFSDCFLWCYWVCSSIPWILCKSKIRCK